MSQDTIEILRNRLSTNKTSYLEASSQAEYRVALRLVEVLSQSFEIGQSDEGCGYCKRDQYMAANVDWVLNEIDPQPEKAFLWAHNEHVMYSEITEGRAGKLVGRSANKNVVRWLKDNSVTGALNVCHRKANSICSFFGRRKPTWSEVFCPRVLSV